MCLTFTACKNTMQNEENEKVADIVDNTNATEISKVDSDVSNYETSSPSDETQTPEIESQPTNSETQTPNTETGSPSAETQKPDTESQTPDKQTEKPNTNSEVNKETNKTTITAKQAKKIAEQLISLYHQYEYFGVCCELEYSEADMSAYLSDEQKQNYFNCQYRLTCCDSVTEAKAHILKKIDASLMKTFSEGAFFFDDIGNFYFLVDPMGIFSYGDISVVEYNDEKIVAEAPLVDIDGYCGVSDKFVIGKVGSAYKITDVYQ